jgi:hypothetical protein
MAYQFKSINNKVDLQLEGEQYVVFKDNFQTKHESNNSLGKHRMSVYEIYKDNFSKAG